MTTRYKTEGEKEGVKRRMAEYRARMRSAGLAPREIWLTDAEARRLQAVVAVWRDKPSGMSRRDEEIARALKPALDGTDVEKSSA